MSVVGLKEQISNSPFQIPNFLKKPPALHAAGISDVVSQFRTANTPNNPPALRAGEIHILRRFAWQNIIQINGVPPRGCTNKRWLSKALATSAEFVDQQAT